MRLIKYRNFETISFKEFIMKNIFKLLVAMRSIAIIILLVIGFSMSACDDELKKDGLEEDEGSIRIEGSSSFTIYNHSSYEINVTIKDSNYIKQSKTIPVDKSVYISSVTPPVTITYSPASKVKQDNLLLGGVYFENK